MSATKHYHVGLVMAKAGITGGQTEDNLRRIKEHVAALGKDWTLVLWLPTFDGMKSSDIWPTTVKAIERMTGTEVCDLPGEPSVLQLFHEVREYDEVWCLPCKGQARLTRARVPQLYYMAQEQDLQVAARFKWIPHWVGDDKLKKGKMI